jgi:hypothetical protein
MSPNSDSHDPDQTAESGGNLKIIDLEFETLRQFRELMAPRLNYEGFFVATSDPLPKGTPADIRAGMALLFNELEHQSREIIDELIDFHIATGGDPFEIGLGVGEAGDIGTDALAADPLETKVPLPEPEPAPEPAEPEDGTPEDILPDWLSEVAQKHDVDLSADATEPVGETQEAVEIPEIPEPTQRDFEISMMPEDEAPDETPFQTDVDAEDEVTIPPRQTRKPPRDLRLWPFLAAAVVLVAASAIVWWIVNRGLGEALPEPAVVVEETPVSELPPEIVEEPTAEVPDKPVEVSEPVPDSSRIEEVAGPATRVLLVAATRVGDTTVVTVRANGDLSEESIRISRLKDPARVWVRIRGIETFYRPNDIEVGTPEVERIRVGHHPEETPQSLYVVFDLGDSAVVVREQTVEGSALRVVVGRQ